MVAHLTLFRRREIWFPTLLGCICLFLGIAVPILVWCFRGESFLALSEKLPAKVLVVEGWIAGPALRLAAAEFQAGDYEIIITTGGPTSDKWGPSRWNYAEAAQHVLVRAGIPAHRIVVVPLLEFKTQRTFQSALAVQRALRARGKEPEALNLFTVGVHARRSALVFAKVFAPGTKVGVIACIPPEESTGQWWHSSTRTDAFITESAGYVFEAFLNSGRRSNSG